MRIEKSQHIGGLSAIQVRKLMRRCQLISFAPELLNEIFSDESQEKLQETWKVLLDEGFVEFVEERDGLKWYELTVKGNALAQASAAKPILRKTAEKRLTEFMQRVEQLNQDDQYVFRIKTVILFGSMLSNAPEVNDIDLIIQLDHRTPDTKEHHTLFMKRIKDAIANGKRFATRFEELSWPRQEIRSFLRAGSRVFSIHEMDEIEGLSLNSSIKASAVRLKPDFIALLP